MRSEIERLVWSVVRLGGGMDDYGAPTDAELQEDVDATTTQLLALFEKMCNEVIGADEPTRLSVSKFLRANNKVSETTVQNPKAIQQNHLRTTQRQALKTKLGEL
jgi:hypothetical protein